MAAKVVDDFPNHIAPAADIPYRDVPLRPAFHPEDAPVGRSDWGHLSRAVLIMVVVVCLLGWIVG